MIIWISLAAVVVVIITICLLALRFLRADDTDAFDELPDEPRRPARTHDTRVHDNGRLPEPASAAAARRPSSRPAPPDEPAWAGSRGDRGGRAVDDRVAANRDRGPDRPATPDRRPRQGSRGPARPVPASARSAMPAQPVAAAGHGTDWDSLSDVDYWAELASDKPLTATTAAAAGPPAAGSARRRRAQAASDSRSSGRGEVVNLPMRPRTPRTASPTGSLPADFGPGQPAGPRAAPGRYGPGASEPATQNIAALARLGSPSPAVQPPAAPLAAQPRPAVRPAPPVPLDDDPLTSPSFPAINASDSRSYRARRPDSQPGGTGPMPAYTEPTRQFSAYPTAADAASSPPGGYPVQPAVPAGNPYGSFVSQPAASYPPQAPAASQPDSSYAGYTDHGQYGAADPGWYGVPPPAGGTSQGQAGPALGTGPGGYQLTNGPDQAAGYYPGYQAGPPETAAYPQPVYPATQYEQRGYGGQEAAYGRDGYQGYPGYGASGY
jgi:hypothetical protein